MEQTKAITPKDFFDKENVQNKFKELLGKKTQGFITSVLQVVNNNKLLATADLQSIYGAAAAAAVLDLPINNNLGFAYIVPYKERQSDNTYKNVAQFQLGYKGFIQLSQRSGQFKTLSAAPIYEGQLVSENPLTGYQFDFTVKAEGDPIGYAAYMELINGFQKILYMTRAEMEKHAKRYSKSFDKSNSIWKNDFESMALKTVTKLLLSKWAPLSIEMQQAVTFDQARINDVETNDVTYIDNEETEIDREAERVRQLIEEATELTHLTEELWMAAKDTNQLPLFDAKREQLENAKNA